MKDNNVSTEATLEKAIKQAIKGGWRLHDSPSIEYEVVNVRYKAPFIELAWFLHVTDVDGKKSKFRDVQKLHAIELVFSHNFAKALWGDPWAYFTDGQSGDTIQGNFVNYLGHLANMAVTENPLKYLEKNV